MSPEELDYVAAVCLDPSIPSKWRQVMEPCMDRRREWLKTMMPKGLQVSVAFEKADVVKASLGFKNSKFLGMAMHGVFPEGLIEYLPIKIAPEPVKGRNSLFVDCIWVVPPFWHRGVAKALLERVIQKAKAHGGISVLAYEGDKWFGFFPYMPTSFFKRFGFQEVDRDGSRVLLHLDFGNGERPTLIRSKIKKAKVDCKMVVDVFHNNQCPWSGWMADRE